MGERPPRKLSRQTLAEVVEPRYEELFSLIQSELRRSGFEELIAAGIVLTGGSAKMEGVVELAEEVFHMPVRLGMPQFVTGLGEVVRNPIHATGVGIHPGQTGNILSGASLQKGAELRGGVSIDQLSQRNNPIENAFKTFLGIIGLSNAIPFWNKLFI